MRFVRIDAICDEPIFRLHATITTKQSTMHITQNRISERDYQQYTAPRRLKERKFDA